MTCKACGGTLRYTGETYVCESCKATYTVADYYENTEVFLCYVENDENGRRTKDSMLAAEIYGHLESRKINTFYMRASASEMIGDDAERVSKAALHSAKTVIVFGTQKVHFEKLLDRYREFFGGKVVLPVYADMDAYDIPKDISAIQALDYTRVGAAVDLTKAVLNTLGREGELDFEELSRRATKKNKTLVRVIVTVIAVLLLAGGVTAALVFGVFSKDDAAEKTLTTEELQAMQYDKATAFVKDNKRAQAIALFSELSGYKDSDQQLMLLYEAYAGYYQNKAQSLSLHLQVWEKNIGAEVTKITPSGAKCTMTETLQMQAGTMTITLHDSENNEVELTITLLDDGVQVATKTVTVSSDVTVGNVDVTFPLAEKSDKPFTPTLDAETLLGFVENKTFLSALTRLGFEASYHSDITRTGQEVLYRVKNTDIYLLVYMYDCTLWDDPAKQGQGPLPTLADPLIVGVNAPASLIAPDKIGQLKEAYIDGDLIFMPGVTYSAPHQYESASPSSSTLSGETDEADAPINTATGIFVIGKASVGEKCYTRYVGKVAEAVAEVRFESTYTSGESYAGVATVKENDKEIITLVTEFVNMEKTGVKKNYRYDKATQVTTELTGDLITKHICDGCGTTINTTDADSLCDWYCGLTQGTYVGDAEDGAIVACPFCGAHAVTQAPMVDCDECGGTFGASAREGN